MKKNKLPRLFFTRKAWLIKMLPKIDLVRKTRNEQLGIKLKAGEKQLFSLSKLKAMAQGEPKFVDKMIRVFIEELPQTLQLLEKHTLDRAYNRIRAVAHVIRPSVEIMQIKTIETSIEQLELYAGNETNLDQIPALAQEVIDACNKTIQQLSSRSALKLV